MDVDLTVKTFNVSKKNLQRQKNNFLKKQKKQVQEKSNQNSEGDHLKKNNKDNDSE